MVVTTTTTRNTNPRFIISHVMDGVHLTMSQIINFDII